jgi:hypothetical protein
VSVVDEGRQHPHPHAGRLQHRQVPLRERVVVAQLAPLEHVEQRIQMQIGDHVSGRLDG